MRRTVWRVNGRVHNYSNSMAVHSARVDVAIGDVTSAPFSGVECAWNEYQNEYQTDSCRYVQMRTDTHGLTFEMRQKVSKIGLKRAIPTLASISIP